MSKTRKAILVVSFGTSFPDTCKKTIDVIEQRIGEHFSDYKIYRAWTSKMIMAKLLERDNIRINNVTEAMEQMITDGITEVIVQPTHVINGIENDLMKEDALAFKNHFERITFGDPLLTTQQDHVEIGQCHPARSSPISRRLSLSLWDMEPATMPMMSTQHLIIVLKILDFPIFIWLP